MQIYSAEGETLCADEMFTIVELTMLNVSLFVCTNGRNGSGFFCIGRNILLRMAKMLVYFTSQGATEVHAPSNTFVSRMDYFCHSTWVFIRRGL